VGSAADLLEVFGIISSDEHCGTTDVLDVFDVVALVVVEKGWDSYGSSDAFMACAFRGPDWWELGALCLGDDQ
jgi:hypothetical protein